MDHTPWRTGPDYLLSLWEMKHLLEVGDFTWRPDTRLKILLDGPVPMLEVKMLVPDTYNPERTTMVTHMRQLPPLLYASIVSYSQLGLAPSDLLQHCTPVMRFFEILRRELHRVSNHEDDEWIRYRGEMLFNPHART